MSMSGRVVCCISTPFAMASEASCRPKSESKVMQLIEKYREGKFQILNSKSQSKSTMQKEMFIYYFYKVKYTGRVIIIFLNPDHNHLSI